jgi:hypothetical protein
MRCCVPKLIRNAVYKYRGYVSKHSEMNAIELNIVNELVWLKLIVKKVKGADE